MRQWTLAAKEKPARTKGPGRSWNVKLAPKSLSDYAESFLVAAAMLSRAAFKVLRDVAMFMRM